MSYGKYFEFRVPPQSGQRAGRYSLATATNIGGPVVASGSVDADGVQPVVAATAGVNKPTPGQGGILVYEHLFTDGPLEVNSDKHQAPAGSYVQVVSGSEVKVALRNDGTVDMVDLTSLSVGDGLMPDTGGLWQKSDNGDGTDDWLIVSSIETVGTETVVEARVNF